MYETFNYVMGYVRNIHAASTKFLSCWSHHKLRLQRPMAARNHYRRLQYDSYAPLAQVYNWTNEDGESRQQAHYFHCDQIDIPREIADKDANLVWFGDYYGWGKLKSETNVTGIVALSESDTCTGKCQEEKNVRNV